jgi:hypothetical protein
MTARVVKSLSKPIWVMRQKCMLSSRSKVLYHARAMSWWMWPAYVRASQTFTSGKRGDFRNFGIVDVEGCAALRGNDRKRHRLDASPRFFQFFFYSAKNKVLHASSFAGGAAFKLPIKRIGNVDRGSHIRMLPYLWLDVKTRPGVLIFTVPRSPQPWSRRVAASIPASR